MTYSLQPLGYIRTCFPEKFGIPRQALLATEAKGVLQLLSPFNQPDCVEGLSESSHVWLTFIFHQHLNDGWKPKVRPPRLGGNKKYGVFATRSPFRPNGLGLSAVKLDKIDVNDESVNLHFSGVDLLDGTPIVDIKPYIPYADVVPNATNFFAEEAPVIHKVIYSEQAQQFCSAYLGSLDVKCLISQILQQDPRPAYQASQQRHYKMSLLDFNIEWCSQMIDGEMVMNVIHIANDQSNPNEPCYY